MEVLQETIQELRAFLPRIVAAVAVLILGWLAAWLISGVVSRCLRRFKLDDRMQRGLGAEYKTESWVSKAVFWLIMLLVLIGFFSVLQLPPVSESLKVVLDMVLGFLPRLLAAILLLLVAWILASGLRILISKALDAARVDAKFNERVSAEEGRSPVPLSKTIATAAYWLIFLLFLPAILSALAMRGILSPVEGMVEKIVAFLPNLFVAGFILLVGWFLARVICRIVTNVLAAVGADKLGEKIGLTRGEKPFSLSKTLGWVVYIVILIPIVIAALDAIGLEALTQPTSDMLQKLLSAIPSVFAAALVVGIAYVIGHLVSQLIRNLLETVNFDALPSKLGLGAQAGETKWSPSAIAGYLVLVVILLFAAVSALSLLGFANLSDLVVDFLFFVGHILMGLVIFTIGLYLSNLVAEIIKSRRVRQASLLSFVARVAILLLAGAMALRQMGLANEIISLAFGLLLGSVAIAGAIAFGIGGREIAAQKLQEWLRSIESEKPDKGNSPTKKGGGQAKLA